LVIIAESVAKPSGFDADHGVGARIVVVASIEDGDAHHIFLNLIPSAR
jgi:hypothetical protein